MGCDIHMFVEVRGHGAQILSVVHAVVEIFGQDLANIIGGLADSSEWILASGSDPDPECYGDDPGALEFAAAPKAEDRVAVWELRDYDLFGCLAGVRNEAIRPISFPRGLPFDVSRAVAAVSVEHSPSYLFLNELDPSTNPNYWTQDSWQLSTAKSVGFASYREAFMPSEFEEWIIMLRQYQRKHKIPDDFIRLVFFFDS